MNGIENPCHSREKYFILDRFCKLSLQAPFVGHTFRGQIHFFAENSIENPSHSREKHFILDSFRKLSLQAPFVGRTFRGYINFA